LGFFEEVAPNKKNNKRKKNNMLSINMGISSGRAGEVERPTAVRAESTARYSETVPVG